MLRELERVLSVEPIDQVRVRELEEELRRLAPPSTDYYNPFGL